MTVTIMTLGERLEEARKRKGISLREAAEATKIRSDYLASLESNAFDIALPPIYTRGFLKIYARFLRLDADKLVTDYDAQHRSSRSGRRDQAAAAARPELLGRLEVPEKVVRKPASGGEEGEGEASPASERRPHRERTPEDAPPALDAVMKVRIALAIIGTIFVLGLGWGLIKLVTRERAPVVADGTGQSAASGTVTSGAASPGTTAALATKRVELIALEAVTVVVDQIGEQGDQRRLYSGNLARGERFPVEFRGALRIQFSEGRYLRIERDGQILEIQQVGVGRTTLR